MKTLRLTGYFVALLFSYATSVSSQKTEMKNELSFSMGASFTSDEHTVNFLGTACPPSNFPACNVINGTVKTSTGFAFNSAFARRITDFGRGSLYFELPLIGTPGHDTQTTLTSGSSFTVSQSSLFLTPSAKVQFHLPVASPFASIGGGMAHFGEVGINQDHRTTGTLHLGGGADFKSPIQRFSFRCEVRYFYSGMSLHAVDFNRVSPSHLHTLFVGGGPVFRF